MLPEGGNIMLRLITLLAATSLAICGVSSNRAESLLDVPRTDTLQAAKSAEMKGDLERVRNHYPLAIAYYRQALRTTPHDAALLNKIGVSELKIGERGTARKYFLQAVKTDPRN